MPQIISHGKIVDAQKSVKIDAHPLIAASFMRNPVIQQLRCSIFGTLKTADDIYENGFSIGNYGKDDSAKISYFIPVFKDVLNLAYPWWLGVGMIEILTPDFEYSDNRGKLTQLVHGGYAQVNVIYTLAGKMRGRMHFHRRNSEAFYVISGKLLLKTLDGQYEFNSGDMFRIPPNIAHDFEFSEDTLLVSMYSQGVTLEDGTKDIWDLKEG